MAAAATTSAPPARLRMPGPIPTMPGGLPQMTLPPQPRSACRLVWSPVCVGIVALLLAGAPALATTPSAQAAAEETQRCLTCHADQKLTRTLDSGETAPLVMHPDGLATSVHKGLRCTDCHAGLGEVPHPKRQHKDLARWKASFAEVCKTCHFDNYTKTLDSVHSNLQKRGDVFAPNCVKCHGSHEITRPAQPRSRISQTCAHCHPGVSAMYTHSVHG